jgi:hypothetical protein
MKNFRFLWPFLFLISCAIPISPSDVTFLRGEWEGMCVYRNVHYESVLTIDNESVPLSGNLAISTSQGNPPNVYPFENGQIDSEGRLIIRLSKNMRLELALEKESGGLKLDGNLYRGETSERIALLKTK